MKYLLALCLVCLPACSWEMKKYDPVTVEQIQRTMQHEQSMQEFVRDKLAAEALLEYGVLSNAELMRLDAWLASEQAKFLNEE